MKIFLQRLTAENFCVTFLVDYVQCRFVKKPSGAKPGFVIFTNQRTLYVAERDDLQKFLSAADG